MKKTLLMATLLWMPSFLLAQANVTAGIAAFEGRRWSEAMDAFLAVLKEDPTNAEAHAYVNLIAREMEAQRRAVVREHRLEMLQDAARKMDSDRQDSSLVAQAIVETSHSEKKAQEDKWHARCEEARLQRNAGHLLAANDVVLQVLAENDSFPEAQRELSELQSQIRQTLDASSSLSITERYALEGFYAYGQADYAGAVVAWSKARTFLEQSFPGPEGTHRLADLKFASYQAAAQDHLDEQRRLAELKNAFDGAVSLFEGKHFTRSLDEFRKVAIRDPEYPQLGYYLVQAEAAAEHERAERLGEEKRQDVERSLQKGLAALEAEHLPEAENYFSHVLKLDPSHGQARSYLMMVRAEMQRRHDPKASQMHYEAGLVAYASGKLDEAMREWRMAIRLNPQHEKAINALAKVQKELALSNPSPIADQ